MSAAEGAQSQLTSSRSAALAMTTDSPKLYEKSSIELTGADMTRRAAREAYQRANVKPGDARLRVVECHDCFAANEVSPKRQNGPDLT